MFDKDFVLELFTELDKHIDDFAKRWGEKHVMGYADLSIVLKLLEMKSQDINCKANTEALVEGYAHLDETKKPSVNFYH